MTFPSFVVDWTLKSPSFQTRLSISPVRDLTLIGFAEKCDHLSGIATDNIYYVCAHLFFLAQPASTARAAIRDK